MTKKYNKFFSAAADFNLDNSPYYWITQVHTQYVHNLDHALKKYGLDYSRRRILQALKANPQVSISRLSEMIICKMSTTTKIVYRLKDEGLVNTYCCEYDGRMTRVVLTDKGEQMAQKINDLSHIVLDQSFEGLTPLQIEKMLENLKLIFRNLAH
jgi:DNA-binding MarR family transcriptional regulator